MSPLGSNGHTTRAALHCLASLLRQPFACRLKNLGVVASLTSWSLLLACAAADKVCESAGDHSGGVLYAAAIPGTHHQL